MTTYYKATRPDGTSFHDPEFRWAPESGPVEGIIVTHPNPHLDDPSGWLSVATVPTDCTGMAWPCRLLAVEPVEGHPVTAPLALLPNKRAASAWRVVCELPATDALGPHGVEVAAIIDRASRLTLEEIDQLAAARDAATAAAWHAAWHAAWAAAWDAAWDAAMAAARAAIAASIVRDLITPEQYDALMAPWRAVVGDDFEGDGLTDIEEDHNA